MAFTPDEVSQLKVSVKELLETWMRIKLAFQKAFSKEEITPEQESAFLQLKSDLSRHFRTVGSRLPKDLQFDGEQMMEMLKSAISMQHLQGQPVNEKRRIFTFWHQVFVKMTRTMGALEMIDDGYFPSLHRDKMKMPKPDTGKGKKKKKKKKK